MKGQWNEFFLPNLKFLTSDYVGPKVNDTKERDSLKNWERDKPPIFWIFIEPS